MAQKQTLSSKNEKSKVAWKRRKAKEKSGDSVEKYSGLLKLIEEKLERSDKRSAKLLEKFPGLLEKIEKKLKTEELGS